VSRTERPRANGELDPMDPLISDLLKLLELEQLEVDLFRGESRDIGSPQVFGGQVLGQALTAASATVEARVVHSLHAYFLRRGDFKAPIVYQVDRSLDGHSFSNRRVVAIQHGAQIFNMAASFQIAEEGLDHQIRAPAVAPPEDLADSSRPPGELLARMPERLRRFFAQPRPFEFRIVQPIDYLKPRRAEPVRQVWFRSVGALPDDERLHRSLLAYVSDFFLLDAATLPHGASFVTTSIVMASLDHAMWFHRSLRVDDWLLYAMESPSASGARGFARASVFTRDGRLVASTAQEGLVRLKRGPSSN
jgi:acyl-CoA thioesterase II